MSNGIIFYRGPSAIDGVPIIGAASGIYKPSRNPKTGPMIQTWVLLDDIAPHIATQSGADFSICGNCRHRGTIETLKGSTRNVGRSCYVTTFQAPRNVWTQCRDGKYATVSLAETAAIFAGKKVRLGAYGDPAAIPFDVWAEVMAGVEAGQSTGYTHQWQDCDSRFSQYCMASVDTALEAELASAKGYRYFRVTHRGEVKRAGEVVCPASDEMGKKTDCASCRACGGFASKARAHITIAAHSTGAMAFEKREVA